MRKTFCITLLAVLAAAGTARAESLIIEGLEQAQATAGERPARGMSMAKVEAKWGTPAAKDAAVGQPPITRWEYPGFVVYFEYDHVIHAVTRRP